MADHADRLRSGRAATATGHLTLDRDKAREKLRAFRLADPHHYVLQVVRAASALGANLIEFTIEPTRTTCTFDAVFPAGALADLWSAAFEERETLTDAALHNLALGVASAQALNPRFVQVISGSARLVVDHDGEELDEIAFQETTEITVSEKFRFGHLSAFLTRATGGELPEARALRERCSMSLLDVRVDGKWVNTAWSDAGPKLSETHEDGECFVLGTEQSAYVHYVLLRDDVQVAQKFTEMPLLGARAALNNRTAPTDLTGLALSEVPASFMRDVRSSHHRLVKQWTEGLLHRLDPRQIRDAIYEVGRVIGQQTPDPGSGTLDLMEWLLTVPAFESAVRSEGTELIGLRASSNDVIVFGTRRVELDDWPTSVALVEHGSDLIDSLGEAGYPVRDVTDALERRALRRRNRLRWLAQPKRARGDAATDDETVVVNIGELRGVVRVREHSSGGTGQLIVDGRLLLEAEGRLPFDVEIDGPLRPNERFDNVDRDAEFEQLSIAMIGAARRLFEAFQYDRDLALLLVDALSTDSFEREILQLLGYSSDESAELLARHRAPAERGDDFEWLLERAGPLAYALVFNRHEGNRCSIRDVIRSSSRPLLLAPGHQVDTSTRDGMVLVVSPAQRRLVQRVRPDAELAVTVVRHEAALRDYMRKAPFRPEQVDALYHPTFERDDVRIELSLVGGAGAAADVFLVWRDRLLVCHRWSAPRGTWRVVIRSDRFQPDQFCGDVVRDPHFAEVKELFAWGVKSALEGWFDEVVTEGRLEGKEWGLFVGLGLDRPPEQVVLPALHYDDGEWRQVLARYDDLVRSARRAGRLSYTSPAFGEPRRGTFVPGELVVQLPRSVDPRRLAVGALCDVDIHFVNEAPDELARQRFFLQASTPWSLSRALVNWHGTVDDHAVHAALYPSIEGRKHESQLVWSERVLEEIDGEDIGAFRSVVSGGQISPNASFTRLEHGREAALLAARSGAREVLRKAAELLRANSDDPLPDRLERARIELAQIATNESDRGDEAWWVELQDTPIFDLPGGGRETPRERAERVARGVEHLDVLASVARLLRKVRGERRDLVNDFTLAGFAWASEDQDALCEATAEAVTVNREHRLVQAAEEGDDVALRFLASCIYTQINAHYAAITDTNEIAMQQALLESTR